ncbi:MAG: hypothetical protein KDA65_18365 [Planctomycetaceae bacterium]|nr:hypothetical protein [Planctomycetaceae bacterium]
MRNLTFLLPLLLVGCLQQTDSPDITPEPSSKIRTTIANSLEGADRKDCLTIYGIYTAASEYVSNHQLQAANAAELYKQLQKMFELTDWSIGKYPQFTTAHETVMDPLLGSPQQTIMDRRAEIADLFKQIALGAQDAAR